MSETRNQDHHLVRPKALAAVGIVALFGGLALAVMAFNLFLPGVVLAWVGVGLLTWLYFRELRGVRIRITHVGTTAPGLSGEVWNADMKLGAKARRYISEAVNEFASARGRADWEEWDRYAPLHAEPPAGINAMALAAVTAKAAALDKQIDAEPEENEDRLADLGNDHAYFLSLARGLQGERVPA